jgi:hypothetical protein
VVASREKKNFENGHTKFKLLRVEFESEDCGQKNQGTLELNSTTIEFE